MPPAIPDKIPCHSAQQFETEIAAIRITLDQPETEDSWEKINRALQTLNALTRGGAYRLDEFIPTIKSIGNLCANPLLSERGRLSNTAQDVCKSIAFGSGRQYKPLVPIFIPPLLKLCQRPNKLVVSRAKELLLSIIISTHCSSILTHLKSAADEKSVGLRVVVGECVLKAMSEWDEGNFGVRGAGEVEFVVRLYGKDSNADVRRIAKLIFQEYKLKWPDRLYDFVAPLTPTTRRYLAIDSSTKPSTRPASTEPHSQALVEKKVVPIAKSQSHHSNHNTNNIHHPPPTRTQSATDVATLSALSRSISPPMVIHHVQASLSSSTSNANSNFNTNSGGGGGGGGRERGIDGPKVIPARFANLRGRGVPPSVPVVTHPIPPVPLVIEQPKAQTTIQPQSQQPHPHPQPQRQLETPVEVVSPVLSEELDKASQSSHGDNRAPVPDSQQEPPHQPQHAHVPETVLVHQEPPARLQRIQRQATNPIVIERAQLVNKNPGSFAPLRSIVVPRAQPAEMAPVLIQQVSSCSVTGEGAEAATPVVETPAEESPLETRNEVPPPEPLSENKESKEKRDVEAEEAVVQHVSVPDTQVEEKKISPIQPVAQPAAVPVVPPAMTKGISKRFLAIRARTMHVPEPAQMPLPPTPTEPAPKITTAPSAPERVHRQDIPSRPMSVASVRSAGTSANKNPPAPVTKGKEKVATAKPKVVAAPAPVRERKPPIPKVGFVPKRAEPSKKPAPTTSNTETDAAAEKAAIPPVKASEPTVHVQNIPSRPATSCSMTRPRPVPSSSSTTSHNSNPIVAVSKSNPAAAAKPAWGGGAAAARKRTISVTAASKPDRAALPRKPPIPSVASLMKNTSVNPATKELTSTKDNGLRRSKSVAALKGQPIKRNKVPGPIAPEVVAQAVQVALPLSPTVEKSVANVETNPSVPIEVVPFPVNEIESNNDQAEEMVVETERAVFKQEDDLKTISDDQMLSKANRSPLGELVNGL